MQLECNLALGTLETMLKAITGYDLRDEDIPPVRKATKVRLQKIVIHKKAYFVYVSVYVTVEEDYGDDSTMYNWKGYTLIATIDGYSHLPNPGFKFSGTGNMYVLNKQVNNVYTREGISFHVHIESILQ